ncbi:MSMEG_0570 family nitrogen starvation response protein [Methylobacillus flagellatus]|uniref:MSMEG_0570 family nitrogen starvation response protein n=1 Tax=Methylobacillus flagellatus TaxID=405 RepID=UPI0010FA07F5|nr:MSMEG_0570 family nitrogen starvation response protein [Methylobacillus flagellatus]
MPVVNFHIVWPDGTEARCYSPSQVIKEHLQAGQTYLLPEFMQRARTGLQQASERVRAKYGYACSAAQDQLDVLEQAALKYDGQAQASVTVTRLIMDDIY